MAGFPWEGPPQIASGASCSTCGGSAAHAGMLAQIANEGAKKGEQAALQSVIDDAAKKVRRIDNGTVNNLVGAVHGMIGHGVLGVVKLEDVLLGCNDQAGAAAAALRADPRFKDWEIKQVTRDGVGPINTGYHHKVYAKSPKTGQAYSVDMHAGREVRPWTDADSSFK